MWERFDLDMITRLVNSFSQRLQVCLNVGGESIQPFVSANKFVVYGPPLGHLKRPPTDEEDAIIIDIHKSWGNRWTKIAARLEDRSASWVRQRWRYLRNRRRLERARFGVRPRRNPRNQDQSDDSSDAEDSSSDSEF